MLGLEGLANTVLDCPVCNHKHYVPFQKISIGYDLINSVHEFSSEVTKTFSQNLVLLYDKAIEGVVYKFVVDRFREQGFMPRLVGLGKPNHLLEPDARLCDQVAKHLSADIDIILGVGSGVISDMTKYIATKVNKPFILYGTAPSMNGYTSISSTMTVNGIKTSKLLNPAQMIFLDVPVLVQAPKEMILAGFGDLTARAICNADWKLSNIVRKTYFCPLPYWLTGVYEPLYLDAAKEIAFRDEKAIHLLAEAILISGISMTMVGGDTSPSSGSEHVLSHYWDLQVELEGAPKNLHGIQVAVGTILSYSLFNHLRQLDISVLDPYKLLRMRPSIATLESENRAKFGVISKLFNHNMRMKWVSDREFVTYITRIIANWQSIWTEIEPYITPLEALRQAMQKAGFRLTIGAIQRSRRQVLDALIYGNRYRPRYTMLDLASELGILPDAADEILDQSGLV